MAQRAARCGLRGASFSATACSCLVDAYWDRRNPVQSAQQAADIRVQNDLAPTVRETSDGGRRVRADSRSLSKDS